MNNHMCEECGCQDRNHTHEHEKPSRTIPINQSVTAVNDLLADQIKQFLQDKKILCVNLMGSPGSGKTTVIEGLSHFIKPSNMVVIQGDLESDIDKIRLEKRNIETHQINTHSGCHLNASMINKVLLQEKITDKSFLIIENVGNLVCPAGVQIGQHVNIVISSVTEGSDKPKKYPLVFMDAHAVVISKIDFAVLADFNEKQYMADIKDINASIPVFKTEMKKKDSFRSLADFLIHERNHMIGIKHHH
jgi:hydrogenase nickel incorporation protein HypB